MGWFIRKSVRVGPLRINLSKRGIGMSAGVKGFRVGTGPRGPYVAGGRGGIYFRQRLGGRSTSKSRRPRSTAGNTGVITGSASGPAVSGGATNSMQPNTLSPQLAFPRRVYSGRALALLCGSCLVGILLIALDSTTRGSASDTAAATSTSSLGALGSIGVFIYLCVVVTVCVMDWRGVTTLNGVIKWRNLFNQWQGLRMWQQVIVGLFALSFCYLLVPIYLVQAFNTYRHAKQEEPALRHRQVAQLEADLGILPPTEGTCRECGKPLQVGAEFCAYCAAPVVAKPLICPACATTALPDARFCPTCRTPLRSGS